MIAVLSSETNKICANTNSSPRSGDVASPLDCYIEWIFAYGSLVWRPGFEFEHSILAELRGWKRQFSQQSPDHRGTPELPGRVLTLASDEQASCQGIAYRVAASQLDLIVDYLDVRESGGYSRQFVNVDLNDGRQVRALTYIALPDNPHACSGEPLETLIELIKTRHGPSGSNLDYVVNLAKSLAAHGIEDAELARVVNSLDSESRR